MIQFKNNIFSVETNTTGYYFKALNSGVLEHLYYGRRIDPQTFFSASHTFTEGNSTAYFNEGYTLENLDTEVSGNGIGDYRDTYLDIDYADTFTNDFIYDHYEIHKEKRILNDLPCAKGQGESLEVVLKERHHDVYLHLYYSVFDDSEVIVKSSAIVNNSNEEIVVHSLMSNQIDYCEDDFKLIDFHGKWAEEMQKVDRPLSIGKIEGSSFTGSSSSRCNPFFMLARQECSEDHGEAYGFNLVYSGNHMHSVEVNAYHHTRVLTGINPRKFKVILKPQETLESPESIMTYSNQGLNKLSHHMHQFVQHHIIPTNFINKERPILLNSWEAHYFDYKESDLIKLANRAKETGIELFVVDDGWFGSRDDDTSSLGDWFVNKKKLPHGLSGLSHKIHNLDMQFGLWVEPEMVNENSECFRNHPDWILGRKDQCLGRNQYLLDLSKEEVQDYIIDSITNIIKESDLDYIKWDYNRNMSDISGYKYHSYIIGLYRVLNIITNNFTKVLFENCASGGNRFDLGMMCYFPQTWISDNSDAHTRHTIQENVSYGYPLCCMTAHVSSCPNHQTMRNTPLNTRFNIASFGILGYECNFNDLSKHELQEISQQIAFYKKYRKVFQYGKFSRLNNQQWSIVDDQQDQAFILTYQTLVTPNSGELKIQSVGLNDEYMYHISTIPFSINIKDFGDLINTQLPIHIKKDSLLHNTLSKLKYMISEEENIEVKGNTLNHCGVFVKQGFMALGYSEDIRFYPDFASRLYTIKRLD